MLTLLPPAGFRTRAALKAEILALRHQLLVLQRSSRGQTLRSVGLTESSWSGSRSCGTLGGRPCSSSSGDRHRLASQGVSALLEVEESALRRPSNRRSGSSGPDSSIRRMSLANPHGGAPHTHGELLKLGIQVSQATLAQRSEEHTSELQSRLHLVCRLLLEKKKIIKPYLLSTIAQCL